MKQLLSLFLFLLPCLAWAQYPSNGNQKITLGEQTTADGLIYRGVLADTGIITPLSDTSAYIILDTVNHRFYNYNRATNVWSMAGVGSISSGLTGVLPVANGGTGSATQNFVDLTNTQTVGGAKTFSSTITGARFDPTSSSATGNGMYLPTTNTLGLSTAGLERMRIKSDGNVGYGTNNPVSLLHIEKAGGTTFSSGDQFRVSSGVSGNRAEFHFTDNITSDAFLSFLPSATIASRYLEISLGGSAGGLAIDGNGKVGILTVAPTEQLHVVGNARITAVGSGGYSNDLNITSTGVLTTASSSDETFKYNINPIAYGLSTILQLKPVSFQWKKGDEHDLGFIAQDAVNIIPEAVDTFWDSSLFFRSNTIIPILTKAIQEQQALIKALEQRIINLENK